MSESIITSLGATKLYHPFLTGPQQAKTPHGRHRDVDSFHTWIRAQPRLPAGLTRSHALLFLHACHWDSAAARKAIQRYCTLRAGAPDIFDGRDCLSPRVQQVLDMTHMAALPDTTAEGYKVLIYRLSDFDPSKVHFGDAVKTFCMFNDMQISEDGLTEGYVVVFDMRGVRLSHLTKVSLGPLRTFMAYIQEAHPVRLKRINVVHTASFINQIMAIVKPLIRTDLMGLLHFTNNGPAEILPVKFLPEDYGGPLPSLEVLHAQQRLRMEGKYNEWLKDSCALIELPKVRSAPKPIAKLFQDLEID